MGSKYAYMTFFTYVGERDIKKYGNGVGRLLLITKGYQSKAT
jgi:hypothetical protein